MIAQVEYDCEKPNNVPRQVLFRLDQGMAEVKRADIR